MYWLPAFPIGAPVLVKGWALTSSLPNGSWIRARQTPGDTSVAAAARCSGLDPPRTTVTTMRPIALTFPDTATSTLHRTGPQRIGPIFVLTTGPAAGGGAMPSVWRIHGSSALARVYTPGAVGSPQASAPKATRPTSLVEPPSEETSGPPQSPSQASVLWPGAEPAQTIKLAVMSDPQASAQAAVDTARNAPA